VGEDKKSVPVRGILLEHAEGILALPADPHAQIDHREAQQSSIDEERRNISREPIQRKDGHGQKCRGHYDGIRMRIRSDLPGREIAG